MCGLRDQVRGEIERIASAPAENARVAEKGPNLQLVASRGKI